MDELTTQVCDRLGSKDNRLIAPVKYKVICGNIPSGSGHVSTADLGHPIGPRRHPGVTEVNSNVQVGRPGIPNSTTGPFQVNTLGGLSTRKDEAHVKSSAVANPGNSVTLPSKFAFIIDNPPEELSKGAKMYKCSECVFSSDHGKSIYGHMKRQHPEFAIKRKMEDATPKTNDKKKTETVKTVSIVHTSVDLLRKGEKMYKCSACDVTSDETGSLYRHMESEHGGFIVQRRMAITGSLWDRVDFIPNKVSSHDTSYRCDDAMSGQVIANDKASVEKLHNGERLLECSECNFRSDDSKGLSYHVKMKHSGCRMQTKGASERSPCFGNMNGCASDAGRDQMLIDGEEDDIDIADYFPENDSYTQDHSHTVPFIKDKEKSGSRVVGSLTTLSLNNIKNIESSQVCVSDSPNLPCGENRVVCIIKNSWENRLKGEPAYKCSECGMKSVNSGSLYRHMERKHKGFKITKLTSRECFSVNKITPSPDIAGHSYGGDGIVTIIRTPWERRFNGEPAYRCSECGMSSNTTDKLYKHMRRKHRGLAIKKLSDLKNMTEGQHGNCYPNFVEIIKTPADLVLKGENLYRCSLCCQASNDTESLYDHMKNSHKGYLIITMRDSGETKSSQNGPNLKKVRILKSTPEETAKGLKPYKCSECDTFSEQTAKLFEHMEKVHTDCIVQKVTDVAEGHSTQLVSNTKNGSSMWPDEIVKAIDVKTRIGIRYKCSACKRIFFSRSSVYNHARRLHKGLKIAMRSENTFRYSLPSGVSHDLHGITKTVQLFDIHDESGLYYQCSRCGMKYADKTSAIRHLRSQHKGFAIVDARGLKELNCYGMEGKGDSKHDDMDVQQLLQREKEIIESEKFVEPIDIPIDEKGHRYKCSLCGQTSLGTNSLYKHMRLKHKDLPILKKSNTHGVRMEFTGENGREGNIFRSKTSTEGEEIVNTNGKTVEVIENPAAMKTHLYKCSRCDYTGGFTSTLYKHMKVHHKNLRILKKSDIDKADGESVHVICLPVRPRPYKCSECNQTSTFRSCLYTHMMRRHKGFRIIRKSDTKGMLEKPRTSDGSNTKREVRRYKCSECGCTSNWLGSLYYHMAHRHRDFTIIKERGGFKKVPNDSGIQSPDRSNPDILDGPCIGSGNSATSTVHIICNPMAGADSYKCSLCNMTSNRRDTLHRHMKYVHEGCEIIEDDQEVADCRDESAKFVYVIDNLSKESEPIADSELENTVHVIDVPSAAYYQYICSECDRMSHSTDVLFQHMEHQHKDLKIVKKIMFNKTMDVPAPDDDTISENEIGVEKFIKADTDSDSASEGPKNADLQNMMGSSISLECGTDGRETRDKHYNDETMSGSTYVDDHEHSVEDGGKTVQIMAFRKVRDFHFKCSECGQTSKDPSTLHEHMKSKHEGMRILSKADIEKLDLLDMSKNDGHKMPLNDKEHDYSSDEEGNMTHLHLRNSEKSTHLYKCSECDLTSYSTSNLYKHMKRCHKGFTVIKKNSMKKNMAASEGKCSNVEGKSGHTSNQRSEKIVYITDVPTGKVKAQRYKCSECGYTSGFISCIFRHGTHCHKGFRILRNFVEKSKKIVVCRTEEGEKGDSLQKKPVAVTARAKDETNEGRSINVTVMAEDAATGVGNIEKSNKRHKRRAPIGDEKKSFDKVGKVKTVQVIDLPVEVVHQYKCSECDQTSDSTGVLYKHMKSHHKDFSIVKKSDKKKMSKLQSANTANVNSQEKMSAAVEDLNSTGNNPGKTVEVVDNPVVRTYQYKCSECDKTSNCTGNLYKHMKAFHKGFVIIKKKDNRKKNASEHPEDGAMGFEDTVSHCDNGKQGTSHAAIDGSTTFDAKKCAKKTVYVIENSADGIKRYKCSECNITSGSTRNLYKHMKRHHINCRIIKGNGLENNTSICYNRDVISSDEHMEPSTSDGQIKGSTYDGDSEGCVDDGAEENEQISDLIDKPEIAGRESEYPNFDGVIDIDDDDGVEYGYSSGMHTVVPEISSYECCECMAAFASLDELDDHVVSHNRERFGGEEIENVDASCTEEGLGTELGSDDTVYIVDLKKPRHHHLKCSECNITSNNRDRLYRHMMSKHKGFIILKKIARKKLLKKAITTGKPIVQVIDIPIVKINRFKCSKCRRTSECTRSLYQHMKISHKDLRIVKIGEIEKVDDVKNSDMEGSGLHVQIIDIPKQGKNGHRYKCSKCDKTSDSTSSLYKHMQIHHKGLKILKKTDIKRQGNASTSEGTAIIKYGPECVNGEGNLKLTDKADCMKEMNANGIGDNIRIKSLSGNTLDNDLTVRGQREEGGQNVDSGLEKTIRVLNISEHGNELFKCTKCDEACKSTSGIERHMRRVHKGFQIEFEKFLGRQDEDDLKEDVDSVLVSANEDNCYDTNGNAADINGVEQKHSGDKEMKSVINRNITDSHLTEARSVDAKGALGQQGTEQFAGSDSVKEHAETFHGTQDESVHRKEDPGGPRSNSNRSIHANSEGTEYARVIVRSHLNGPKYKCSECGKIDFTYQSLYKHMSSMHTDLKIVNRNKLCDYRLVPDCKVNGNENSKTAGIFDIYDDGKKWYKCSECDYVRQYTSSIYNHIRGKHKGYKIVKKTECALDDGNKPDKTVWATHVPQTGEKRYKCSLCSKTSEFTSLIYKHMRRWHRGFDIMKVKGDIEANPLHSDDDNGRNANTYRANNTDYANSGDNNTDYASNDDNNTLETVEVLDLDVCDGKNALYKCSRCDETSENVSHLYGHMKRDHRGFKIVERSDVSVQVIDIPDQGNGRYKCSECERTSYSTSNLYKHMKQKHKGYKIVKKSEKRRTVARSDCVEVLDVIAGEGGNRYKCSNGRNANTYRANIADYANSGDNNADYASSDDNNTLETVEVLDLDVCDSKNALYKCSRCDETSENVSHLYGHMKRDHRGFNIVERSDVSVQVIDIPDQGNGRYKCSECERTSYSTSNLYKHMKQKHKGYKIVRKSEKRRTVARSDCVEVLDVIAGEGGNRYKCSKCDKRMKGVEQLYYHIRHNHKGLTLMKRNGDLEVISSESESEKESNDDENIKTVRVITLPNVKEKRCRYKCSLCSFTNGSSGSVYRHMRSMHKGFKIVKKVGTNESNPDNHHDVNLTHSSEYESSGDDDDDDGNCTSQTVEVLDFDKDENGTQRYKCSQCHEVSDIVSRLYKHVRKAHTGFKLMKRSDIKVHVIDIPDTGKGCYKYKCSQCHLKSHNIPSLYGHMKRDHKGFEIVERSDVSVRIIDIPDQGNGRYKCSECERTSYSTSNLYKHMKQKHKGYKIVRKSEKRRTVARSDCVEVLDVIAGEGGNRYKCSKCDKRMKGVEQLYYHIRHNHKGLTLMKRNGDREVISSESESEREKESSDDENIKTVRVITLPNVKGKHHKCSLCSFTNGSTGSVYRHMRSMHKGFKIVKKVGTNESNPDNRHDVNLTHSSEYESSGDDDDDDDDDDGNCTSQTVEVLDFDKDENGTQRYKCSQCHEVSDIVSRLYKHVRKAHTGFKLMKRSDIKVHVIDIPDTGKGRYKCSQCHLKSHNTTSLYRHMKRKHRSFHIVKRSELKDRVSMNNEGDVCENVPTDKSNAAQRKPGVEGTSKSMNAKKIKVKDFEHLKTVQVLDLIPNQGRYRYKCSECGKPSESTSLLYKHMRHRHKGSKIVKRIGGVEYVPAEERSDDEHVRTVRVVDVPNNGKERYKCSLCFMTSDNTGALYKHMVRMHKGYKIKKKRFMNEPENHDIIVDTDKDLDAYLRFKDDLLFDYDSDRDVEDMNVSENPKTTPKVSSYECCVCMEMFTSCDDLDRHIHIDTHCKGNSDAVTKPSIFDYIPECGNEKAN